MVYIPVVAFFLYCSSCNRIGEIKAFIPTVSSTTHPSTTFSLSAKTNNFLIPTKQYAMTSQPAIASAAITQRLYPASMIGTLGEAYFRMTKEMACPRGVAVGYLAQIFTILISIPMISIAKSSSPDIHSILQVDWLHFIESFMFWASIHVQCISFRDSVGSVEKDERLPASVVQFKPMTMRVLLYFGLAFALTVGHYFANPTSWQSTILFGGYLNAPAPKRSIILCGELSFLTWIFHWSMIYDYVMLLRSMWRWGDFTSKKWKLYTWLHLPACLVNAIVMINHMHRDQIVMLRLLHPVMVFLGSIATFWGSFAIARANGWGDHAKSIDGLDGVALKSEDSVSRLIKGSNLSYTVSSFAFGALLAYASIYLTV